MLKISNRHLNDNLRLAWDLARRDLAAKYRRSIIGSLRLILTSLCVVLNLFFCIWACLRDGVVCHDKTKECRRWGRSLFFYLTVH